jgi:deoxyribose-phosphate aldolase
MSAAQANLDPSLAPLARRLLSLLDLTSLNDADDERSIAQLARLASTDAGRVAALCTWPRLVPAACRQLRGSAIPVAAVANFPAGAADVGAAAAETAAAIADGADEIDVVFPYHEFLAGQPAVGLALVAACRRACGERVLLKVILETGQLKSAQNIRRAAETAIEGGAHFLKTSTGRTTPGATPEAAAVLLEAIAGAAGHGLKIGCKVSGGIRTLDQARSYLELYETRFGAGSAHPSNFRIGASTLTQELMAITRSEGA